MVIGINKPIEQASPPDVIWGKELSQRQHCLLALMPVYGSRAIVKKRDVSMHDLAALTAKTGDEFAMFTRKGRRLIVRGDSRMIPLSVYELAELNELGYRWSGHTNPGRMFVDLEASYGDKKALLLFTQDRCAIYNALGKYKIFESGG